MMPASPYPPFNAHSGKKRLLVTGCDARYFPLLEELVASVRRFPETKRLDIACIDGGLKPEQIKQLKQLAIPVHPPYIPAGLPERSLKKRPSLAIGLSKLWLDRFFPHHDTILWLDADTWVQESSALELLFGAAETNTPALATIPELFLHKPFRLRWLPFDLAQIRSILYKNSTIARLPRSIRRTIGVRPTLNGGIFALSRTAPHWQRLRYWQEIVLKHGKIFPSDQLSLSLCGHIDPLPVEFLPPGCNYMGPWYFNSETGKICEHIYPHPPAGIIHLAGYDKMRLDVKVTTSVKDEKGKEREMSLRFASLYPDALRSLTP
ncbi:glycosyltransferase [Acetobacteraceae bacterium ESL0709]|nr:glycosyltransferase [Acetobacteraceae bacterium ESL0697]MDF7677336.1 glycosyltransferase [Acetobacteraceae bacterium ESL0709]